VLSFAAKIERRLRQFDKERGRRGWANHPINGLFEHLKDEVEELFVAIHNRDAIERGQSGFTEAAQQIVRTLNDDFPAAVIRECADVANMAMMIADVTQTARTR
jgi:chorismate mutase